MISIIIPVYNSALYLAEMLDSVLNQTYKDIEIILVNDGSQDDSSVICHTYAQKYDFIRVFDRDNHGPSASRNFGAAHARGDFVWFMDSDDILADGALAYAVEAQKEHNADVVIGGMTFCFVEEGINPKKTVSDKIVFSSETFAHYYREIAATNYVSSLCNKLIRRSVIVEHSLRLEESLCMYEDYVFSMDLLQKSKITVCLPTVFYLYKIRGSVGLARRYRPCIESMYHILREKIIGYRNSFKNVDSTAVAALDSMLIYIAYECVKNESRATADPVKKIKALLKNEYFHNSLSGLNGSGRMELVRLMMKARQSRLLYAYLKLSQKVR